MIELKRFARNPLITSELSQTIGGNINGASVIKTPQWLPDRLGRYYLYFSHHKGRFIRMAFSDNLEGQWRIYEEGTLHLNDAHQFRDHIASPDVHVDPKERKIRMYFHGVARSKPGQWTGVATSKNGINFQAAPDLLGKFYFRVWENKGKWYAIAKNNIAGWGELYKAESPDGPFKLRGNFLKDMRHGAVITKGDDLEIFYTRVGDSPERILRCKVDMKPDWLQWTPTEPEEILRPECNYEGAGCEIKPSKHGSALGVCELRDPFAMLTKDGLAIFYSGAGESNICGAYINDSFTRGIISLKHLPSKQPTKIRTNISARILRSLGTLLMAALKRFAIRYSNNRR